MEKRKKLAFELTKKLQKFLVKEFNHIQSSREKTANDFVTNVDLQAEKMIIKAIQKNFPEDLIESEEAGKISGKSEYKWIIDPLDGTNNYVRGIPQAGAQIAILKNGQTVFGVLLDAFNDIVYCSEKGKGAYKTNTKFSKKTKIKVSDRPLGKAYIITCSKFAKDLSAEHINKKREMFAKIGSLRINGVAINDLPFVAQGSMEALISLVPKSMDITAGALLIEEAGGKVTTFKGDPWYPDMPNLLATNGVVHDELLKILKSY